MSLSKQRVEWEDKGPKCKQPKEEAKLVGYCGPTMMSTFAVLLQEQE